MTIFLNILIPLVVAQPLTVEAVAEQCKPAIVVVTAKGRTEGKEGLGTGFFISKDGLIVTNYHVISEGRMIHVETQDGKEYPVIEVHALDRENDLAILKIEKPGCPFLEIRPSGQAKAGSRIVAIGNPHGLKHSVVAGHLSGTRDFDGRKMLQLAIPIEPGNSGGPVMDLEKKVIGILSIKSLVTENLGFAIQSESLIQLKGARPARIPMKAWLTVGAINEEVWESKFGGQWRQRAGKLLVENPGEGFGGRALLLRKQGPGAFPYEVEVELRMREENGAAGLVFDSDGNNCHYGFYPSSGQMRLTRFEGPDVYSWKVLRQEPSKFYRTGEWNHLKVLAEKEKFTCFLNGENVYEESWTPRQKGVVGLAKFRHTTAEFKGFQIRPGGPKPGPSKEEVNQVARFLSTPFPGESQIADRVKGLKGKEITALPMIQEKIRGLEANIAGLNRLRQEIHQAAVATKLREICSREEKEISLVEACMWVAKIDRPDLDIQSYLDDFRLMGEKLKKRASPKWTAMEKLQALKEYFHKEKGFHGSQQEYYNRANSYLPEVLDDREGLPITLAVLFIELGNYLDLNLKGIGLPGHFLAGLPGEKGQMSLIDVFDGSKIISQKEAEKISLDITGEPLSPPELNPVTKKQIVFRVLSNLLGSARKEKDEVAILRFLDCMLAVDNEAHEARGARAGIRAKNGNLHGALEDVDHLLKTKPMSIDLKKIGEFRSFLLEQMSKENPSK